MTRPLSRGPPCTTTLKGAPAHPETEDIRDMMVTDITLAAFTLCNSARVVACVAQLQGDRRPGRRASHLVRHLGQSAAVVARVWPPLWRRSPARKEGIAAV